MASKRKLATLVLRMTEVLLVGTCLGLAAGRCCVRPTKLTLPITFSVELVRTQFVAAGLVVAALLSVLLAAGPWFSDPPRFVALGAQAAAVALLLSASVLMFMFTSAEEQADSRVLGSAVLALLTVPLYAADAFVSFKYFRSGNLGPG